MAKGIIAFKYTNAYDVYSADALNILSLDETITQQVMDEEYCFLHCKNIEPVIEVMEKYGFTWSKC